jgi:hypothetical protein
MIDFLSDADGHNDYSIDKILEFDGDDGEKQVDDSTCYLLSRTRRLEAGSGVATETINGTCWPHEDPAA